MPDLSGVPHQDIHLEVLHHGLVAIAALPQHAVGGTMHDKGLEQLVIAPADHPLYPHQLPHGLLQRQSAPIDLTQQAAHVDLLPIVDPILHSVKESGLVVEARVEGADGGMGAPNDLSHSQSLETLGADQRLGCLEYPFQRVAAALLARSFDGMCGFGHVTILAPQTAPNHFSTTP